VPIKKKRWTCTKCSFASFQTYNKIPSELSKTCGFFLNICWQLSSVLFFSSPRSEGWTKLCNSSRRPDKQINCRWHNTVCQRGINQNYNQCHKILGKATPWHEEHGHTFSIYYCLLSFWLTFPRGVLSTSRCCLSRPCMVFLECVQLALFLAFSFSRQHPCFLIVWPSYAIASLLWQCLTVPSLLQLC